MRTTQEVLSHFQVTEAHGLSDDRAKEQQQKYGKNGTRLDASRAALPR